ncbi:hypothetical protein CCP3SC15_2310003 [Gammaproteobacteria bacterium]
MTDSNSITSWLYYLREFLPLRGILLVGAGAGNGDWVQLFNAWETPNTTLIEADESQYQRLLCAVSQRKDWQFLNEVIAGRVETVTYHQASNNAESSLVEPLALRSLWPNIETRQKQTRQAITLADVTRETEQAANWLVIDCLPSLPILQGAAEALMGFDFIAVRVLLKEILPEGQTDPGNLTSYFNTWGYRCIATIPERHPALGHMLYVRDIQAMAQQLQETKQLLAQSKAMEDRLATERQIQIEILTRVRDEQTKLAKEMETRLAMERQTQIETLTRARDEQTKLANECKARIKTLEKEMEDRLATERQTQLEILTRTRDEQTKLTNECKTRIAALEKEKTEAMRKHAEVQSHTQQLEVQNAECLVRQQLQQDELTRAETQIELIKDLLLRESWGIR